MPSYDAVWIPTLVVAQVLGWSIMLYALEQLQGTVTGLVRFVKWKFGLYSEEELRQWSMQTKGQHSKTAGAEVLPKRKRKKRKKRKKASKNGKRAASSDRASSTASPLGAEIDNDDNLPLPVELSWENVSCTVQPGGPSTAKEIIHTCSGSFFPCEAVALMGPSGAGKSTLLDILAGRKTGRGVAGSVCLNGMEITPEYSNMYLSYVGQEDVFMPTLSAWESLSFVANLCMDALPRRELERRMEGVLQTMGLLRVKHTKVGGYLPGGVEVRGLSGGEKRRLSIACGLIGNPSILFLDEPTTGLDSFAALAVMKYLNALTDRGHTIVSSIHQPRQEIFASFDKVLVLSEGYALYLAPPSYVVPWFSQVLGFPYEQRRDGTVADWLITTTSVGFRKGTDSKARSMSSVEEVKTAAERFVESSRVMRDAEDAVTSYLESEDLESVRDATQTDLSPPPSIVDGVVNRRNSEGSMLSGSVFSGPSSFAGGRLLPSMAPGESGPVAPVSEATREVPSEVAVELLARRYSRSWMFQFWMLWKRSVMHQIRNPAEAATRILTACISGILPGLVFIRLANSEDTAQQRLALLFFAIVMFCMTPFGFMAFPLADKRFFILDSARGLYTPSAYVVAYIMSNIPFFIINSWASVLVTYGLAGLRYQGWAIMQSISIITLHALVTNQFVTMCIWLCNSQDMAFSLATIYISFSLLICGFYIRIRDMTLSVVRGLTWASFSKYSFQGLAITELGNRAWTAPCQRTTQLPGFGQIQLCDLSASGLAGPNPILRYYDFNLTIAQCCAALLAFWALFCIISYLAMLRLYKRQT